MAGIADNNVQPINTAPIAAIGSEQAATPAVNDFMAAFRSGFITVDDITRRTKQSAIDTSNLQTTISTNDLTRRKVAADASLLPAQTAEAQTQLDIAATTAPARLGMAQEQADRFARFQADPEKYVADEVDEKNRNIWIQAKGPLPSVLMVKNPEKRPAFSEWAATPLAEAAERGDSVTEDRLLDEYHRAFPEKISARKGTPEYAMALRDEVDKITKSGDLYAAKLKAAPSILEKRALEGEVSPERVAKLQGDITASPPIKRFREQRDAAELVNTLSVIPNPTNRTDLQLIYAAVKLADPGSVVREGEIALSRQADPVLVSMKKRLEGVTSRSGKLLDAKDRAELARISEVVTAQAVESIRPELQKFSIRAQSEGVPLDQVLSAPEITIAAGAAAPKATAGGTAAPTAGAKRVIQNGVTFEWNGAAYMPIQ